MKIKLLIDNVDRTSRLLEDSWSIDENDGDVIDVVELDLDDHDNTLTVTEGKDLVIEDDADATVRFFGGIIDEVHRESNGLGKILRVTALDWKVIADRAYFTAAHVNKNDSDVIKDSFTEAAITEINTADLVQTGRQLDHLIFRGASLRQMLDTVTDITGWFWDIDKFKKLIYRPYGDVRASFDLSDDPNNSTTFPYYEFRRVTNLGQYQAVEIRGAEKLTTVTNQTYSGDGTRKRFRLSVDATTATGGTGGGPDYPQIFRGPEGADPDIPTIDVNTGTDGTPVWTAQSVGIEEQDTGKDVLWNPAAHQVIFTTAPPNFATNSWRISGRALVPITYSAVNEAAAAAFGRTFKKVLVVPEVEDIDQAQDLAEAFLREQGAKDYLYCTITKDGLVIGDTIAVTNTIHSLTAKLYQCHQISMRLLGGQVYEYNIVLRNTPTDQLTP